MKSLDFTYLVYSSDTSARKLNRTSTKSLSRNISRYQTFAGHTKDASLILKNIGLTTEVGWETYRVNALYNFSYKRNDLYKYQRLLAYKIKDAIFESNVAEYNSVTITVQFEKLAATAFTTKDNPAIKVSISALDISGECFEIFCGFLLSVERNEGLKENERLNNKATILSLALVSYVHKIFLQSFVGFLEENFSCLVSPLKFSSLDLKWILTLFSAPDVENKKRSIVLEYRTPYEDLKSIEIVIDTESVSKAWKSVIKRRVKVITEDHVKEFISKIENEFCELLRVDLSGLELCVVKTPVGVIRTYEQFTLKVNDSMKLYLFMKCLTHLSQEY